MLGTRTDWVERPWGRYLVVHSTPTSWTKTLIIREGAQLSLQFHEHRDEVWHAPEGRLHAFIGGEHITLEEDRVYTVPAGTPHRVYNPSRYELPLVEVALGLPDEDDIIRLEDDYGRADV